MSGHSQFALLTQRRFLPYFIVQALGAFNDNVYRQAIIGLLFFLGVSTAERSLYAILAPAIFGAALIAIVYVLPEGVVGGVRRLLARLGRRSSGPVARPAPASASDVPNDSIDPGGSHEEGT